MQLKERLIKWMHFSKKEAEVYLVLLQKGESSATEISKWSNINRVSVYEIIRGLVTKGLVSKFQKNSKAYFSALPPQKLLEYLDHEKRQINMQLEASKKGVADALPQLISMQNIYPASKPKVKFFEGKKGMREAYEDALTADGLLLAYANAEVLEKSFENFFPDYYKRRVKNGIYAKAILTQNPGSLDMAKRWKEEMRTVKFLPGEEQFSPEVNIYNDKMLIISWQEEMAIIIESKEFVKMQKVIFETLWNRL